LSKVLRGGPQSPGQMRYYLKLCYDYCSPIHYPRNSNPNGLCGPPSLLSNGYWGLLARGETAAA
jgi:hypothetical protein